MGDRANVKIAGVHLYTHGGGSKLPQTVQDALKRRWRWDDDQYLARIVFCEMVKDDVDGETGYGISAEVGDGASRIVEIDTDNQRVIVRRLYAEPSEMAWTIDEFIALDIENTEWLKDF